MRHGSRHKLLTYMDEKEKSIAEKAGARHNRYDAQTLVQLMAGVLDLGAICPYCGNKGYHDEEEGKALHSRGSTHAPVPSDDPIAVRLQNLGIDSADLHENGIEDEPHVTIKYGLDDVDLETVKQIIEKFPPFTVTLGAARLFQRDLYDVLYIQVESEVLREIYAELTPIGDPPNYDTYSPHLTIAYLLVGRGSKYLPIDEFVGMTFEVNTVNFSDTDDEETAITLRGTDMPFNGMSFNGVHDYLYDEWNKYYRQRYETETDHDHYDQYSYLVASYYDYVIVRFNDGNYYEVAYAVFADNEVVFTSRENWVEQEKLELWIAKHAEYLAALEDKNHGGEGNSDSGSKTQDEFIKAIIDDKSNFLKAVGETDEYWILANHIVLWGDEDNRDAEGQLSDRKNDDGTIGEWFTPKTDFDSEYMKTGILLIDIEHGKDITSEDAVIGTVEAKSMLETTKGLFAKRLLSKQSAYVQWLQEFYNKGIRFATSSLPVQSTVQKKSTGEITAWGFKRDAVTFAPMEPRMYLDANTLEEMKMSIGVEMPETLYEECLKSGMLQVEGSDQDGDDAAGADRQGVDRTKLLVEALIGQARMAAAI